MSKPFTVSIFGRDLIDWLEEHVGHVYENIGEEDRITKVRLGYGDEIRITIGEEEDD